MKARANGITLEYEIEGPADAPTLLMIHGVGAQLIQWPRAFCDRLLAAGFCILRYDARDIGRSTHLDDAFVPDLTRVMKACADGGIPELPYTLSDLAADAAGLLDAVGIRSAHILGVSLGGMVAQALAIGHPERVASLAIMMSQSGNPDIAPSNPRALAMLSRAAPNPFTDRNGYLDHQVELNRELGSPAYPVPIEEIRRSAGEAADRAWNPKGAARQLAAGRGSADRRAFLRNLSVPTVVIHGSDDPLIPCACGEDIADNIERAWMIKVRGMGHDLPRELFELFVGAISANCAREVAGNLAMECANVRTP